MYVPQDYSIRVEGTLVDAESFANTWCVIDQVSGADIDDAIAAFHAFYDSLSFMWPASTHVVNAHWRRLDGFAFGDGAWSTIDGTGAGNSLPTECAVRVSLSAPLGTRGGPFLPATRTGEVVADGGLESGTQGLIVTALGDLDTALQAADWKLGIDQSSSETTAQATVARVGRIFDVIRRRRNNLPEAYASVAIGA